MEFNNYENYIILIDEISNYIDINLFEVESINLNIPINNKILIRNITDININSICSVINTYNNKSDSKLINLIKIKLNITLEFINENNEIEILFLQDTIGTKLISNNLLKNKLYFHLNFSYVYIEKANLYFSMIYTTYCKKFLF